MTRYTANCVFSVRGIILDHEKLQRCSRLTEMRKLFEERPIPRDIGTLRESSATSMDES